MTRAGTTIVRGDAEVAKVISSFGLNAASDPISPFFYAIADKHSPRLTVNSIEAVRGIQKNDPRYKIKYITDIQKENLTFVKAMLEAGFEVRHIEGVRANLGISRTEYVSSSHSLRNGIPNELIWSRSQELVSQMTDLFSKLWDSAIPAEIRIGELERGITLGATKLTFDASEILKAFDQFVRSSKKDVCVILSTEDGLRRNVAVFQQLAKRAREGSPIVRILVSPSFLSESPSLEKMKSDLSLSGIEFRMAERLTSNFYLGIYDQKDMITAEFAGPGSASEGGILHGMITSSFETIAAMYSIFEALWFESELRDREERSKKKAQLLQDILTHDIRNYNQVAKLSAELLVEQMADNQEVQEITRTLVGAIDGSTRLLERARKLGKVLAEENPELHPVDLEKVLARAFSIVETSNPNRTIVLKMDKVESFSPAMADDLLEEVFSNIFSNAVKYTPDSKTVRIRVKVASVPDSSILEISISDEGAGIPEDMKPKLFSRYLESAKGSGLGMSIVHALVVERYKGRVSVSNREKSDYTKGTVVKIYLPRADAS